MAQDTNLNIIFNAKDNVSKTLNSMNKKIKSMQPAFRKMAIAGTVAFGIIAKGANEAIKKARDFEEETNKFNVVFQDVASEAEKMAETLNKSYGLSRLESKKLLSATGDILTGFGFTGKGALDLASKVNTLSVDLASFTNAQGGAEAVSNALTKALLGERESLKTYGIAIQEADVNAELLAMGMEDLTGEALRQAKAQATLNIAFRQSKNAVGDYARSNGSLAKTQKELKKSVEDLQITIGQTLAPILQNVLDKIEPIITKITEWIDANPQLTRNIIIASIAIAGLVAVIGLLGLALPAIISGFALLTASPIGLILAGIGLIILLVVNNLDLLKEKWTSFMALLENIGILDDFKLIWEELKTLWQDNIIPLIQTLKTELEPLLPILETIGKIILGSVVVAFKLLINIIGLVIVIVNKLFEIAKQVIDFFKNSMSPTLKKIGNAFLNMIFPIRRTIITISELIQKIKDLKELGGGGILSRIFGRGRSKVDDAIIKPDGQVIRTNPADTIIATQNPDALTGGGSNIVINVTGNTLLDEESAQKIGDEIFNALNLQNRGANT
ncbi:MAG: phage tail tape measure protein [Candidatus Peribacteraceae bacterium]|nr:phage tail tape measure protein [Candidatus Peribacteraceae bacterium]